MLPQLRNIEQLQGYANGSEGGSHARWYWSWTTGLVVPALPGTFMRALHQPEASAIGTYAQLLGVTQDPQGTDSNLPEEGLNILSSKAPAEVIVS